MDKGHYLPGTRNDEEDRQKDIAIAQSKLRDRKERMEFIQEYVIANRPQYHMSDAAAIEAADHTYTKITEFMNYRYPVR